MKITYEEMRDVASRLPVGYYLGRKVPVMVEPSGGAYVDMVKCEIHVGMSILAQAAGHIDAASAAKWSREKLLRCVLYHEVGHVLLSPEWLASRAVRKPDGSWFDERTSHDIVNIFEDERMERVLSSFFIGVDFGGFVRLVNGEPTKAATPVQRIFLAVRMRKTTPKISAAVDDAIQALSQISAANVYVDYEYQRRLDGLVKMIIDEPEEQDEKKSESGGNGGQSDNSNDELEKQSGDSSDGGEGEPGDDSEGDADKSDKGDDGDEEKDDGEGEDERDGGDDGEGNDNDEGEDDGEGEDKDEDGKGMDGDGDEDGEDAEDGESEGDESEPPDGCQKPRAISVSPDFLKSVAASVFATPTPEVAKTLQRFAQRIAKKKGAQAAGRWSALYGRIDTRRDAMDKERIFRRRSDVGERLFSSVNLTLWVDVSGSFIASKEALNQILAATAQAMRMANGKLAVNVVKMSTFATVAAQHEWMVNPDGDNDVNDTYESAWRNTRDKSRRNIDIVVFDGTCCYSAYRLKVGMPEAEVRACSCGEMEVVTKIWNNPDCWIVSDTDNQKLFDLCAPKSHRTYMKTGYAKQLQAKVVEMLDRIL